MATINRLAFSLDRVSSDLMNAKVTYIVHFSPFEATLTGLTFKEEISLWGQDGGLNGPDDMLVEFPQDFFNSTTTGFVRCERTVVVSSDQLDEDSGILISDDIDEVYANVTITPTVTPVGDTKTSNVIQDVL